MNRIFIVIFVLTLTGCAGNEFSSLPNFPSKSSGNGKDAAIYTAIAIAAGEMKDKCSYGHSDDQVKCSKAKKNESKNK